MTFKCDSQGDGAQSVTTIYHQRFDKPLQLRSQNCQKKKINKSVRLIYLPFGLIIWSLYPNPVTLHERLLKRPLTLLVITQPPSFQCSRSSHGCPMAHQHSSPWTAAGFLVIFASPSPTLPLLSVLLLAKG